MSDYIEQSFSNLAKKKLRTFLTTFGVVIGIGALVSMFAFGQGVQSNITDRFKELELFNYVNVFPPSTEDRAQQSVQQPKPALSAVEGTEEKLQPPPALDEDFIQQITKIEGVESAFPEIRFPAHIRFRQKEEFSLVQVLPANICGSALKLRAGKPYTSDEENSLIISDSLLHRMNIKDAETVIGQEIEISTLVFELSLSNLAKIISFLRGKGLPLSEKNYIFTISGVTEKMGFGGPGPWLSDVIIPPGTSKRMKKLSLTSIWDFFQSPRQAKGYSLVSIKLFSPKYVEPVRAQLEQRGFKTFALIDELQEIKTAFIFMDMFLFAVAMIAITVASLGIVNTMVMSILERYKEIGIMKAVGASDRDVKKIFFFESGVIGFLGGIFGLALGWAVSRLINQVVNYFLARQGVPHMDYFSFPWWLCLGAVAFSIVVSLTAGIYPTLRAARVDPVVALRHD